MKVSNSKLMKIIKQEIREALGIKKGLVEINLDEYEQVELVRNGKRYLVNDEGESTYLGPAEDEYDDYDDDDEDDAEFKKWARARGTPAAKEMDEGDGPVDRYRQQQKQNAAKPPWTKPPRKPAKPGQRQSVGWEDDEKPSYRNTDPDRALGDVDEGRSEWEPFVGKNVRISSTGETGVGESWGMSGPEVRVTRDGSTKDIVVNIDDVELVSSDIEEVQFSDKAMARAQASADSHKDSKKTHDAEQKAKDAKDKERRKANNADKGTGRPDWMTERKRQRQARAKKTK